ncbi:DUF6495 family protein [Brumimicrobium aurantiacum]|uniref:Uncharacterized protein n=1 Tax=Brumimicrobium aurantiacum TaxID=1737063 RepID=A0A3E1EUV6_9FLAO|nr:DUF6495 family protein [Brumimicrobium aurantiacum]RFC53263.1 hypothetical protein DXU93_13745 [Brumimicrobium aurantiacum]
MKYTRLPLQDLKDLEKEFIDFLAVNGIPADEWVKLKENDIDKVEGIIDQFSDVIWEGVLRKTEMVEHRRKDKLTICKVEENQLITLLIKNIDDSLDMTNTNDLEKILSSEDNYEVVAQKTKIETPKPEQLFELLKVGFYIVKDERYAKLLEKHI